MKDLISFCCLMLSLTGWLSGKSAGLRYPGLWVQTPLWPPNYFLEHNEGPSILSTFDAATGNWTHDPWLARVALRPQGYTVLWQRRRTMTYLVEVTMPMSMMSAMVIVPCSITTWWQMASRTSCFVETLSITPVFTPLNLWGLLVPEKGRNPGFPLQMSLHGWCKKWSFSNKQASGNYVK